MALARGLAKVPRKHRPWGASDPAGSGADPPQNAAGAAAELAALEVASEDGIVGTSLEGVVHSWNAAAERIYGYGATEMVGRSASVLIPETTSDEMAMLIEACKSGACVRDYRATRLRKDGSRIEVSVSIAPVTNLDGDVTGLVAMVRDVTEAVRRERTLAERDKRFRQVFHKSPVGKVIVSADLEILEVNMAFADVLGYEPAALIGKTIGEITYLEDVPAATRASMALVQGEVDSFTLEKRYVRADGSLMWGRLTATALRGEDGELEACLGAIEDVTERIRHRQQLAEHQARLRMALESASMWAFDRDLITGIEIRWGALLEEFGLSERGEFDEFLSLLHPDDSNMMRSDGLLGEQDEFVMNVRLRTVTGEYRWVQRRGSVTRDTDGRPLRVTGTSMDITQERLAEIRGAEAEANLSRVIEASPDAFVSFDANGIVTRWNPAAQTIFGWPEQEALGRPGSHFLVPFEQLELARTFFKSVSGTAGPGDLTRGPMEMTGVHRDGRRVPLEASWVAAIVGNELRISAFIRDLTERKASQAELERLALLDPLTGLPNRALMHDRLQGALNRMKRHGRKVGVLFLDLDRFKVVNDSLGHDAGDSLLCVLGDRISRALRSGDTLGRLGGDEFVVVAEEIGDARDLASLAERILAAISRPLHLQGYEIAPSASIGIAVAEDGSGDTESLLRDADLAMYRAKARGGGDYELFDFEMRQRAMSRLASEGELRRALSNDELRVHFQPYLESDGKLHGVEALVRWLHPERGLVAPAEFIGLAEETGLVVPLGEWVLRAACRQVTQWRAGPHPELNLSVNLSVRQLAQPGLAALVADILSEEGLEASALCLEITETALMEDPGAAAVTLGELRRLGVRIAVDDFGTGYSSLLYLRHFPIQILKLDHIFVAGVCENSEDRVIIGSIIELAHALGLTAVAEGVETVAQLHALEALGCDLMQGYYWSRPLDAESMTERLNGSNHLSPDRTHGVPAPHYTALKRPDEPPGGDGQVQHGCSVIPRPS